MQPVVEAICKDIADARATRQKGRISTPAAREICRKHHRQVRGWPKEEILQICDELLVCREWEKTLAAFEFAYRIRRYDEGDFSVFYRWLNDYVDGWGSCDDLCTHAFGWYVYQHPRCLDQIAGWTESGNCWVRRAAAVVLIYSIRRGKLFEEGLQIADRLLLDQHDLVRKGYGWMLKEISNKDPKLIYDFVMARKHAMPRVSLRYAIEKMDPQSRNELMA
jgi:3-methyladenine DNA glycosylase AlkD